MAYGDKEIKVEITYTIGMTNNVQATFDIETMEGYFKRYFDDMKSFLTQALKGERNFNVMVDVTKRVENIVNMESSTRFILRTDLGGFEERKYCTDGKQYSETPAKTFGTEGNCRAEMRKAILNLVKKYQKEMQA